MDYPHREDFRVKYEIVSDQNVSPKIIQRYRVLRWSTIGLMFLAILIYEFFESAWLVALPKNIWVILDSLVLVLFGLIAYLAVDRLLKSWVERERLKQRALDSEKTGAEAYRRLKMVLHVSQELAEASEESEVVELLLHLAIDLIGADGASFVPLDEHAQPLAAMTSGEMPFPVAEAWMEYLASPVVRQQCGSCQKHEQLNLTCPLLKGSFIDNMGMYCLPLRHGEQEYGVLNLYIPSSEKMDKEVQAFLRTLLDETTLALERVRLRKRELETLRQLQAVREKADLSGLLSGLLENLHKTLEADFALVKVLSRGGDQPDSTVTFGDLPENTRHLLDGVISDVLSSGEPVLLGNVSADSLSSPGIKTLLAVPLVVQKGSALGALLVASRRARSYHQRQMAMLQTIASQVALVVQQVNSISELEYKTMMDERTRLAREIHDGLAQTLGFLKLKMAQMRNYLENGDYDRLGQTIPTCYETLSDAYQDARQAIDGLRISASSEGFTGWVRQIIEEFKDYSGIRVNLSEPDVDLELPPEVSAQLIRIVQEALSNIRKHAHASCVDISCQKAGGDLLLEIHDDGCGFSPEDVRGASQHGLRGMRERAELIGADFQVISRSQAGTTISIRLAKEVGEGML